MDSVADILGRLTDVRGGNGHWTARCPAHEDKHPSLSITESGGRVLLYCHAGCSYEAIKAALGLPESRDGDWAAIRAVYDYRDESGSLLYQAVRLEPKSFRVRRVLPGGEYEWSMRGVKRRVLYHLPDIVKRPEETVWIVEGEKDADTLARHGFLSTTNIGGAGKWDAAYSQSLAGRSCIIIPDNDDAGRAHAYKVASALYSVAAEVRILTLEGLPHHGDVTDWLELGHTPAELTELAKAAPLWSPPPTSGKLEGQNSTFTYKLPQRGVVISLRACKLHGDGRLTTIMRIMRNEERIAASGLINLAAERTRNALAKDLEEKAPLGTWEKDLDNLYVELEDRLLSGEPRLALSSDDYPDPMRYLLSPLIPEGEPTILFGDGESGKSMLAMLLGILVSAGLPHERLRFPAPEQRNVLYLDWERQPALAKRRLYRLALGLNLTFPTQMYYRRMTRRFEEDSEAIAEICQQDEIGLIIVDSLLPAAGVADQRDPAAPADSLFRALASLKTSALVVAHRGKDRERKVYGSVFFRNLASCVWEVLSMSEPGGQTLDMGLFHDKANLSGKLAPIGIEFVFDDSDEGRGPITAVSTDVHEIPEAAQGLRTSDRILHTLKRRGRMTLPELAAMIESNVEATRQACIRLEKHRAGPKVRIRNGLVEALTDEECPF